MPSQRARKPTARPAATKKRSRQRKIPSRPSPNPVRPSGSSPPSSPPPSAQKTPPVPPPLAYIVEYSIFFEHIKLKKNTELGGARGSFDPRNYETVSQEIAFRKANKEGLRTYLFQNEVSIKPLGGKGDPWSVEWIPATGTHWAMNIEPIILQIASEAKKGHNSTVCLTIKSVYSQYDGFLPAAPTTAQSAAAASQQTPQEPPISTGETSKTPAKRGRSTIENMLVEAQERDRLTLSSVSIMPLMKRWKCSLISCYNSQQGGEC